MRSIYAAYTSLWFSLSLKLSISVSQRSQTLWFSLSVLESCLLVIEQTSQTLAPHLLQCLIGFLPKLLVKEASHSWHYSVGLRLTASRSNLIGRLLYAWSRNPTFFSTWPNAFKEFESTCNDIRLIETWLLELLIGWAVILNAAESSWIGLLF